MEKLLRGLAGFQRDVFPRLHSRFKELASSQRPEALFITCADSRVVPQLFMQAEPGDIFICRNVGNIVPSYGEVPGGVSGTIEYAVQALRVRHLIVCGHSDCGAMKGVLHPEAVADMPAVAHWLRYGEAARRIVLSTQAELPEPELLARLTEQNVLAQLANLRTHPSVAVALVRGELQLHGWMYSITTGVVEAYDEGAKRFRPLGSTETTPAPQPMFADPHP